MLGWRRRLFDVLKLINENRRKKSFLYVLFLVIWDANVIHKTLKSIYWYWIFLLRWKYIHLYNIKMMICVHEAWKIFNYFIIKYSYIVFFSWKFELISSPMFVDAEYLWNRQSWRSDRYCSRWEQSNIMIFNAFRSFISFRSR